MSYDKITAEELAEELTNFVNYSNHDADAFIEAFKRQHRTLQQSSFRLILKLIQAMAQEDYLTDGRNADSKMVAKMLVDGFKPQVVQLMMRRGTTKEAAEQISEAYYGKADSFLNLV